MLSIFPGCVAERTRTTAALSGTVILTCTKPEQDFVSCTYVNDTICRLQKVQAYLNDIAYIQACINCRVA